MRVDTGERAGLDYTAGLAGFGLVSRPEVRLRRVRARLRRLVQSGDAAD
jgi:hypothetical protein